MAEQSRASWAYAFLLLCSVWPATGFIGTAYAGLRRAESCGTSDVLRSAADRGGIRGGRSSTLPRPVGVGGLRAALEVELARDLEVGGVLVSGKDNYGHMTFKVWNGRLSGTRFNKTEIQAPRHPDIHVYMLHSIPFDQRIQQSTPVRSAAWLYSYSISCNMYRCIGSPGGKKVENGSQLSRAPYL